MFEVSREEAVDIDEELDFVLAEFFCKQRKKRGLQIMKFKVLVMHHTCNL